MLLVVIPATYSPHCGFNCRLILTIARRSQKSISSLKSFMYHTLSHNIVLFCVILSLIYFLLATNWCLHCIYYSDLYLTATRKEGPLYWCWLNEPTWSHCQCFYTKGTSTTYAFSQRSELNHDFHFCLCFILKQHEVDKLYKVEYKPIVSTSDQ